MLHASINTYIVQQGLVLVATLSGLAARVDAARLPPSNFRDFFDG